MPRPPTLQTAPRRGRSVALSLCATALAWHAAAVAVTPLTPRLDDRTRSELVAGLAAAGVPDVAAQSVVLALAAVLGVEAADHRFDYRVPHRHLPEVDAVATRDGPACATARATVRLVEPVAAAVVDGRYCVAAGAVWHATRQAVAPVCRRAVPPGEAGC